MKLQTLQFIQTLTVQNAEYEFTDSLGKTTRVLVEYAKNTFFILENNSADLKFTDEVESLARGLLARKHAVNLAKKPHLLVKKQS